MKVLKFGAVWCSGCLVMKPRWHLHNRRNSYANHWFIDDNKTRVINVWIGEKNEN